MEVLGSEELRKQAARERQRRYRAANKDIINARARERRNRPEVKAQERAAKARWLAARPGYLGPTRQALVDHVEILKREPCMDCGNSFPTECMDFDHVRGTKRYNIGTILSKTLSMELLQEELDKCELVCANCHRIRTRKRANAAAKELHAPGTCVPE